MIRLKALHLLLAVVVAALAALVLAPAASGQSQGGELAVRGIDGTDQKAVKVTFLWTGAPDALKNLTIREDGVAKKVDSLTDLRKTETRLATVFVVDTSGSMADDGALTRAKAGIAKMAAELPEGDQMAIVSFTNEATVESPFTDDVDQLTEALDAMAAPRDGRTALYDGIRLGTSLFDSRPKLQHNLVLVTDGADDVSEADLAATRASMVSSGAALFAVDLTHVGQTDVNAIQSIIDRTGGAMFHGESEKEVADAFTSLSTTMRSQFVASYASTKDQGSVNVSVGVGGVTRDASYVVGTKAEGAATTKAVSADKAFGPQWMRSTLGAVLAFVLVGVAVGLGAYAFAALASKDESGLNVMLRVYDEGGSSDEDDDGALAQTALLQRAVEITEDFAERQGFLVKVELMLERADLPLRAAEALFFYIAAVVVVFVGAVFGLGLVPGILLTVVAGMVPVAAVNFIAGRRGKKFVAQLPDTLNLLSGSLRAGYSLMQGVEAVSQEVEEPMGKELRRVVTEARLGREIEDSMDAVAERMDSPDFGWAVMAVRIQREVGGNLSELLLTVADTMVQRDRLRRDVSALTAEGKISAIILGLLPIGLGLFMWMSNPEYMAPLSGTTMGQVLLGVAGVTASIGFLWMKKIINIEI
ncbi:MAG: VWA domain-containing protein [Acidimicrobiales bacterium]